MRYLKGSHYCLFFGHNDIRLEEFTDVDMVGDMDTRNYTTGYLYTVAGAVVSWVLSLQGIVALSNTEVE